MKRLVAALILGLGLTACGHTDKADEPSFPPVKTFGEGHYGVSCSGFELVYEVSSARTTACVHLFPGQWIFSVPTGKTQGCEIHRHHGTSDVADVWKLTAGQKSRVVLREGDVVLPTGWCDGKWTRA